MEFVNYLLVHHFEVGASLDNLIFMILFEQKWKNKISEIKSQ